MIKIRFLFFLVLIALFMVGCSATPADVRAGKWSGAADFGEITFEVDPTGTKLTSAVVSYKCSSGPVTFSETINLKTSDEGWPIKNNKFVFEASGAKFKLTGKFSSDNTQVSGTLSARSCSGKWEASR